MAAENTTGDDITQVYVVTAGEYSDYRIASIWLTLGEAQRAVGKWGQVEVWPIGDHKRTLGTFSAYGDFNADTGEPYEWTAESPWLCKEPSVELLWWKDTNKVGIRVTADTQERADKVYSETRARVLNDISLGLPAEAIASHIFEDGAWRDIGPQDHDEARR